MRKLILISCFAVFDLCIACGGCVDFGIGAELGSKTFIKFEELDRQTISEIRYVIDKIHQAHKELEVSSKEILMQHQKILELQAEVEQKKVFNMEVINLLQHIIDSKKANK